MKSQSQTALGESNLSQGASRRERFEQERMTRRAALRRIGMTSGLVVFSLLTVDDLARLAAEKLKDNKATEQIGTSLAKEFQGAGVAFATTIGNGSESSGGVPPCNNNCDLKYKTCQVAANSQYSGFPCGPYNILCPDLRGMLRDCDHDYALCNQFCNGTDVNGQPNSGNTTFDPTTCQDHVDQQLLATLEGPLLHDGVGAAGKSLLAALQACAEKGGKSEDVTACAQQAVIDLGPKAGVNPAQVDQYLKCAYAACLMGLEPTDSRNKCALS